MKHIEDVNSVFNRKEFLCEACIYCHFAGKKNSYCHFTKQFPDYDIYCDNFRIFSKKKHLGRNFLRKRYLSYILELSKKDFFKLLLIGIIHFFTLISEFIFIVFIIPFVYVILETNAIKGQIWPIFIFSAYFFIIFNYKKLYFLYRFIYPNRFVGQFKLASYYFIVLSIYSIKHKQYNLENDVIYEQKLIKIFGNKYRVFSKEINKSGVFKETDSKNFGKYVEKIDYDLRKMIFDEIIELYTYKNDVDLNSDTTVLFISKTLQINNTDTDVTITVN